jgi:phosphoglycerol transferase MdoB-like AlkP superfamily enzyme
MSERTYLITSAVIFVLVAMFHLVRLVNHWSVQIGATAVPFWGSWLGLIIMVALSVWAFRLINDWRTTSHH